MKNAALKIVETTHNPLESRPDRLAAVVKFSNELKDSRLREIKARWTPEKRAKQGQRAKKARPWLYSTGPKTPEGRSRSSQNARKHPDLSLYNLFATAQSCWVQMMLIHAEIKVWHAGGKPVLERRVEAFEGYEKRYKKALEKAGVETLDQLMKRVREKLAENGIENPALDARVLVSRGGNFSPENMIAGGSTPLDPQVVEKIDDWVSQRIAGGPVSRISGGREFWGLHFNLSKDTLDPRPDTEILVEKALLFARDFDPENRGKKASGNNPHSVIARRPLADAAIHPANDLPDRDNRLLRSARNDAGKARNPTGKGLRILDLGTGSGCILLSLLHELPEATGIGVDLSPGAVEQARANAASLGLQNRAEFRVGSWFDPIGPEESFALIVSNPPYIPESDIPNLAKEVRNHDPILALDGGKDGLDPYPLLFEGSKKFLECGGRALYEFGAGQCESIQRLVRESEATLLAIHPDLAGIPRVAEVGWGESKK